MKVKPKVKEPISAARHAADFVMLGITLFVAWFLWPAFLGGSSRMITVQGHSMEPTYHPGDLVLIDAGAEPEIGHIVVFQIPKNEPGGGSLVVHRVIGRRVDGTYITQGDNTQSPDVFLTTRSDILGSPRFAIPHGGRVIGLLRTPIGLAAASGGLLTMLLWPRKKVAETFATEVVESAVVVEMPTVDEDDWSSSTLPDDLAAEAEAWLQSQLASLSQSP